MRVVAIVGSSGSGKTTLIERLIPVLRARGLTVSTVKHTHHHDFEIDTPGKDSHRHRLAGASEVMLASDRGWARIAAGSGPATLETLLAQLRPVDLVLVEGFKELAGVPRIEVFRGAGRALAESDPAIAAVALGPGIDLPGYPGRKLSLAAPEALADFILSI